MRAANKTTFLPYKADAHKGREASTSVTHIFRGLVWLREETCLISAIGTNSLISMHHKFPRLVHQFFLTKMFLQILLVQEGRRLHEIH